MGSCDDLGDVLRALQFKREDLRINLPFKDWQLAEARTFEEGFRGAWFRCRIRKISKRKGRLGHVLEYCDFPDEELKWTTLYQATFHYDTKRKHKELMLRPQYPPIYNENQVPHVSEVSEVTVIAGKPWRVGDLVDWWTTGCYWSGRLTKLLGDNKAQIDLKLPPLGEGSSYEVHLEDLRPSLDWSPELGWTVPTQEGDTGRPCARIVNPINQVVGRMTRVEDTHNAVEVAEGVQRPAGSFFSSPISSDSAVSGKAKSRTTEETRSTVSKKQKDKQERSSRQGPVDGSTRKTSGVVTDSGQSGDEAEAAAKIAEQELNPDYFQKKYKGSGGLIQNSKCSDTVESAMVKLEQYVNKVKWLKKILQCKSSSSDAQWKFMDPVAP